MRPRPAGFLTAFHRSKLIWIALLLAVLVLRAGALTPAAISISDFGAVGDGSTLNTGAIQSALDAAAKRGGGEVLVPAGRYLSGSLVLKSRTTLHLNAGAVLLGSTNRDDYPIVRARWEGIETNCHRALISADHAEDIAITGAGVIEGSPVVQRLRNPRGAPVVEAIECRNVRVEGVTLKSTRMWTLHPAYCRDVRISGVTFETTGANSDGIDPDSCKRVVIDGCTFSTGDDNIAIKSGKGQEGVRIGRPCEDILITNCTFIKGYTSIAFGSELSGGIRRVRISHCTFRQGRAALQLKSRDGRAGYLQDITAEHLVVGPEPLLEIDCNYRYTPDSQGVPGTKGLTRFSNIRITDVKITATNLMSVAGTVEKPVDGLKISNVTGTCNQAAVVRNARRVILTGIHLEGISGPAWFTNNVIGTSFEGAVPYPEPPSPTKSSPAGGSGFAAATNQTATSQVVRLNGDAGGKRFDGIGVVNGGGATSVLLKDYPEPQRSQILDLVFKPGFGASVSALYVEIPGDGNSTQGSMPSHMHTRDDLNYSRGYEWWVLREAKKRNPSLTLDGAAWSAPGWIGGGNFWSQDTADYYVKWLQGLRDVYGLQLDAIGCRNEKGVSYDFVKMLRATLNANGFEKVKIHAFDNWPSNKLDFVRDLLADEKLRDSIDVISAHTFNTKQSRNRGAASAEAQETAARLNKPIWNTEEHVYLKGFDCAISIVQAFNDNFIHSGATKIVNWYDIAGVYPTEPYSEDPAMLLARSPWSGHYEVREALWGYAHYGQFTQVGWQYLNGGCGELADGGSFVTLKSPGDDYSIIIETKDAKAPQQLRFETSGGLSTKKLCVWRSDAKEQFVRQADIKPVSGAFTITLEPDSIYSLSTTTGQQKGSFDNIPAAKPFPFPYSETFDEYSDPKEYGCLPRYTADIAEAFEIADRPDKQGKCLRQFVPVPPISWAPEYMPYTILGDDQWQDYEVSADVYLNPGDSAGVMGRIIDVGPGFRSVPKGYFLTLGDDGQCHLVVIRGLKGRRQKLEGDAEQQALIISQKDDSAGGEKELGRIQLPDIGPNQWHSLKLRFEGSTITGFVDDKPVLTATDTLYSHGMAGLRAGSGKTKLSTPYFDNLLIKAVNAPMSAPSSASPEQLPMYGIADPSKTGSL